jgi:hypothetical protein
MNEFPRTEIGHTSASRLIIGSNWFLGFSHTSKAKDEFIKAHILDAHASLDGASNPRPGAHERSTP